MTLLEVMERTGIREAEKCKMYIREALMEIEQMIPEQTSGQKIDVVANTRWYNLPSNMESLLGVFRKWDTTNQRYVKIPEVQTITVITSTS